MSHPIHRPGRTAVPPTHAPNAALLIDFDNVTLGIRSDLTKELRTLLNSDIIKGKVAVQRAYADWRRYPQYIVPLAESSIDLIFAPAFGTNKKNATDIRLAVDAVELVFTRPEIGTFILLSGDSDFSSMVIKLKEYGKYVIGVGIRESASDLLIQNCDEYYSYSDLAGLTKEEDVPSVQRDPWELAREAVAQMARSGDVMRSDRLKQVMQQIDPNFDEKNAGFSRFSKFVTEAGTKGVILVSRMDNGQYEVTPAAGGVLPRKASPAARDGASAEDREKRSRRGRRGRGRERRGDERGAEIAPATGPKSLSLANAFQLMTRALGELPTPVPHETLRSRMAALAGREDPLLEPGRFARLLRQANDAEVADVRKIGDDDYEILIHPTDMTTPRARPAEPPPAPVEETSRAASAAPAPLRFRRGSRIGMVKPEIPMVGVVHVDDDRKTEKAEPPEGTAKPEKGERPGRGRRRAPKVKAAAEPASTGAPAAAHPPAPRRRSRAPRKKKAE